MGKRIAEGGSHRERFWMSLRPGRTRRHAAPAMRVRTLPGTSGGGSAAVRFGRNTISRRSGRYHSTYNPPRSACQNWTPISTAADCAIRCDRFLRFGHTVTPTTKPTNSTNSGSRYAQCVPVQMLSVVGSCPRLPVGEVQRRRPALPGRTVDPQAQRGHADATRPRPRNASANRVAPRRLKNPNQSGNNSAGNTARTRREAEQPPASVGRR